MLFSILLSLEKYMWNIYNIYTNKTETVPWCTLILVRTVQIAKRVPVWDWQLWFLLALSSSASIGSSANPLGNPQNWGYCYNACGCCCLWFNTSMYVLEDVVSRNGRRRCFGWGDLWGRCDCPSVSPSTTSHLTFLNSQEIKEWRMETEQLKVEW